MVKMDT